MKYMIIITWTKFFKYCNLYCNFNLQNEEYSEFNAKWTRKWEYIYNDVPICIAQKKICF